MGNKKPKKRDSKYYEYVKNVMLEVYQNNKRPKKLHYQKAVLREYLNDPENNISSDTIKEVLVDGDEVEYKSIMETIRPSVSRAIDKLCDDNIMKLIDNRYYVPIGVYEADVLLGAIINEVKYLRRDAIKISPKVCLIKIDNKSLKQARDLFTKYIGEENIFTISKMDNILLVAVQCNSKDDTQNVGINESSTEINQNAKTKEEIIVDDIISLVEKGYDNQHAQQEK